MDWSTIATVGSVISIPATLVIYVAWAITYGPAFTSKNMVIPAIIVLCLLLVPSRSVA